MAIAIYFFVAYRRQVKINKAILPEKKELYELNEIKNLWLAVLSHDLRPYLKQLKNINTKIKTAVLKDDIPDLHELGKQNYVLINNAYSFLDNMLHRIMEETERLSFTQEKINLKSVVDQVCFDLMPFLELKKISLMQNIDYQHFVYSDMHTLKIAFRNVLENAIKYTPEYGVIKIYAILAEDGLNLVISDNGMGMDKETLQNLFNAHQKIRKKDTDGSLSTGLGLPLVKTMIEKNGGTVSIKSKPGKGTKVIISLTQIS